VTDEAEVTDDALIHSHGQAAGQSRLLDHGEVGGRARIDGAAAPPAKRVSACSALMFSTRDIVQVGTTNHLSRCPDARMARGQA
jgi:hypothetical protein